MILWASFECAKTTFVISELEGGGGSGDEVYPQTQMSPHKQMYSFSIAAGTSNRNLGDFKQHKLVIHCCKGYKPSTGLPGCNQGVGRAAFFSGGSGSRGESIPLPFQFLDPATLPDSWPPSSAFSASEGCVSLAILLSG